MSFGGHISDMIKRDRENRELRQWITIESFVFD